MYQLQLPQNEPVFSYEPHSPARDKLKARLDSLAKTKVQVPCLIGGKEVFTETKRKVVMPHDHQHVLAEFCWAGPQELKAAADAALKAKKAWEEMEWSERASIFLKAADLIAGPYRDLINAATMLGQSKNAFQAEIDSACELVDFFRFNAYFYQEIIRQQPISSTGIWNRMDYRALDGFVLAITPFNFTAIAANLPAAPAMLGNTVVWKPSDTQVFSAYFTYQILKEAGLPDGVINFVPADGPVAGQSLLTHSDLGGVHFTGSTNTFQTIWKSVGQNIHNYRAYPRLVGETGGKDFVFAHASADAEQLSTALLRGAFEYQGQKCSAASRTYIPKSLWPRVKEKLLADLATVSMGDVRDFKNFVNAVIDEKSLNRISKYIEDAKNSSHAKILAGGNIKQKTGYFVEPTVILAEDPKYKSMVEEIFGPVLSVYVYEDSRMDEVLKVCDESTSYALTGAIFAQDRFAVQKMSSQLRHAAGNFYINDKPTGAVVGQQPFGGSRASGTNDKAGSPINLYRWLSPRVIKETFSAPRDYRYPFMS